MNTITIAWITLCSLGCIASIMGAIIFLKHNIFSPEDTVQEKVGVTNDSETMEN